MSWSSFWLRGPSIRSFLSLKYPRMGSYLTMNLDSPAYAIGSFEGFLVVAINYATWFLESSARPIIDDCLWARPEYLGALHMPGELQRPIWYYMWRPYRPRWETWKALLLLGRGICIRRLPGCWLGRGSEGRESGRAKMSPWRVKGRSQYISKTA